MIAQVREDLLSDGYMHTEQEIMYKVVSVFDGQYRPAVTHMVTRHGDHRIVYTLGKHFVVGKNLSYPAFAFRFETDAIDFLQSLGRGNTYEYRILSCIAYEWVTLMWYMAIGKVKQFESIELFWSTTRPFSSWAAPHAAHMTPLGTVGLFDFEIEDVIYGG